MSASASGTANERVFDPVFVIMLVAVILAVAASIVLRVEVGGFGPSQVRADSDAPFVHHRVPAHASAPVIPPSD